jgi:hypothetical protein
MLSYAADAQFALGPQELAMLQRVFDFVCETRSLGRESSDATHVAAYLVDLYERGVRQERQLMAMVGQYES